MEYFLAIRKNEILPLATTWMELEGIMLSEVSQSEKDRYPMILLICGIWETQHMNIEQEGKEKEDKNRERQIIRDSNTEKKQGCWRRVGLGNGLNG